MSDQVPLSDLRPGIGPPRFGLRTMLLLMTAVCVVLVAYTWFGAYVSMLLALFVLAIFAHIAGNWLGTRLRDAGSRQLPAEQAGSVWHSTAKGKDLAPQHFAPASHLHQRSPLPRFVVITVGVGLLAGTAGGALLVWFVNGPRATLGNVAAGAVAFGILGAFFTFLLASFAEAGWRAVAQATRDQTSDE
jgi:hypothetical protein